MVMLHIKLKGMKYTITCSHVPMQTKVTGNLFVVHFSIELQHFRIIYFEELMKFGSAYNKFS